MDQGFVKKLAQYVQPKTVFVFSKSYCPWCDKAKDMLSGFGVKFNSIEVDQTDLDDDKDFVSKLHSHSKLNTYPKIYIGMNCIGGYSDMSKLFNNMSLFKMFKEEGIEHDEN